MTSCPEDPRLTSIPSSWPWSLSWSGSSVVVVVVVVEVVVVGVLVVELTGFERPVRHGFVERGDGLGADRPSAVTPRSVWSFVTTAWLRPA